MTDTVKVSSSCNWFSLMAEVARVGKEFPRLGIDFRFPMVDSIRLP